MAYGTSEFTSRRTPLFGFSCAEKSTRNGDAGRGTQFIGAADEAGQRRLNLQDRTIELPPLHFQRRARKTARPLPARGRQFCCRLQLVASPPARRRPPGLAFGLKEDM